MPKPNYRFDKRQRELAKQKKKEEKRLKKEARKAEGLPAEAEPGAESAPEAPAQ